METRISIIIPTRNRLRLLKEALESALAQDCPNSEVIVVDDASEDDTWAWLASERDPRLKPLRLLQRGERSAVRNQGLRNASGEFVLFLDDDDQLAPAALNTLYSGLRKHHNAIAAIGAKVYFCDTGLVGGAYHPSRRLQRTVWPDIIFGWVPAAGQALIRKEAVLAAGGWNESLSLAEDHELWLRLGRLGPVFFLPDVVVRVRVHRGNTSQHGAREIEDAFRHKFVSALPRPDRRLGERILTAHRELVSGHAALADGRYATALVHVLRTLRMTPEIALSPVSRDNFLLLVRRCLLGMVLGRRGLGLLRSMKAKIQAIH